MWRRVLAVIDAADLHLYGGLLILATGAGLVYPPAALIVPGAVLVGLGVLASWPRRRKG